MRIPVGCTRLWLALLVLIIPAEVCPCYAQQNSTGDDGYVTFYSRSVTLSGGLPRHDLGACKGRLFDGDKQLAFMEPARFVTFRISAGPHAFSAGPWMYKHSNHGAHVSIHIAPGRHYFLECGTTFGPPFVIREIACPVAWETGEHTKPLESAHLRPDGRPLLVPEASFPQCP